MVILSPQECGDKPKPCGDSGDKFRASAGAIRHVLWWLGRASWPGDDRGSDPDQAVRRGAGGPGHMAGARLLAWWLWPSWSWGWLGRAELPGGDRGRGRTRQRDAGRGGPGHGRCSALGPRPGCCARPGRGGGSVVLSWPSGDGGRGPHQAVRRGAGCPWPWLVLGFRPGCCGHLGRVDAWWQCSAARQPMDHEKSPSHDGPCSDGRAVSRRHQAQAIQQLIGPARPAPRPAKARAGTRPDQGA